MLVSLFVHRFLEECMHIVLRVLLDFHNGRNSMVAWNPSYIPFLAGASVCSEIYCTVPSGAGHLP
jgi:hypothetical protein